MKIRLLALIFISVCLFSSISSQAQKKETSKWIPEEVLNMEDLRNAVISPNENMVVWTKKKAVKEKDKFVSDIYLTRFDVVDKEGFKTIQLTNGEENDYNAIFSENGEFIYFLSTRDKGKKLWKMSIYGGEPIEVKEFNNKISDLQWQNENTLLFLSEEGETLYEKKLKKDKDETLVVEDSLHWKAKRVFSFNIKTEKINRITNNPKPATNYVVSPDGNWLVYSMERSRSYASDMQKDPFYYLQNLKTGEITQIIKDKDFPSFAFQFSKDSNGFYFASTVASDPKWNGAGISELFYFSVKEKNYSKVNLKHDFGIGNTGFTVVGNDVMVSLANRATNTLAYFRKNATDWTKITLDLGKKNEHVQLLAASEKGNKVIYEYSTMSKLPSYFLADVKKSKLINEKELVKLNKNLSEKHLAKSEIITWQGYNNEEVTGLLYYPENYEEGKKYPLILSIHGGPMAASSDTFSESWGSYPNILSQRGAFVLKPNYHGSSNHGLPFLESIKGNYYEPEMEDISKAIDYLDKKGMIDVQKLGTMGWSNGAILTTMLSLRFPNMFKFAAAGAGDVNWTSDYGTCRFGVSFDQSYFIGAPWDDVKGKTYNENYILKSPIFEIEKIKTPTIIFHGGEDRAVPRDQGWEYYRGLQQVGAAPVKFLWFPGEPHSLGKITHQLRKMKEELAWIDTYLFNKPPKENEAFDKESPLAQLLKLEKASKIKNKNYGEIFNEKLIPETVLLKKDSISIGRFEVTNAQFKAYKSEVDFPAEKDNYPVLVSKIEAENYVKWLSEFTQENYRLPNEKEAKNLQKEVQKAAKDENTLNYWAGYDITIDEVALFKEKLSEATSNLIKEVGSFKSYKLKDAEIYDLGGNVAEYYINGIYGYSAYDFYDAHNNEMPNSQHVGFRVVKEVKH